MSDNNNIIDPHDQNHELLAIFWDGLKRKGDGKCYCPCSPCKGFKRRKINIKIIHTFTKEINIKTYIMQNLQMGEIHVPPQRVHVPYHVCFVVVIFILLLLKPLH